MWQPCRDVVDRIIDEVARLDRLSADVDRDLMNDVVAGALLHRLLLSRRPVDSAVEQIADLLFDETVSRRGEDACPKA